MATRYFAPAVVRRERNGRKKKERGETTRGSGNVSPYSIKSEFTWLALEPRSRPRSEKKVDKVNNDHPRLECGERNRSTVTFILYILSVALYIYLF